MTFRPLFQNGLLVTGLLLSLNMAGCDRDAPVVMESNPRPVTVEVLTLQPPPGSSVVTASVASWKTEQIGFEVGGRVEYVLEPNTEIEGRVFDENGALLIEGTPIGRLESERYQLAVELAKSDVIKAEQDYQVAEITLNESIPAEIAAAAATLSSIRTEFDRKRQLLKQNAISQSEVEQEQSNLENAQAQLLIQQANEKSQLAQIESLKNVILQARQNLRDAERNLEDCVLYSSFNGQIADISVVPGSVVSAGQAAVTVQMMDPIKVEFEVSAEESRRLEKMELLPVRMTTPDGQQQIRDGLVYRIDPVADPQTRTFTVTLLVLNKKVNGIQNSENYATTKNLWRLDFQFLPGAQKNMLFVEEKAILTDQQGDYLWQITNFTIGNRPPSTGVLNVRKLRITPQTLKVPFLGNWIFQHVIVNDEQFDPEQNFVVGEIEVPQGTPDSWDGDKVVLDSGDKWMLRPGDLVKVDLSGNDAIDGYFVPMDAVVRTGNESSLFVVDETEKPPVAKRIPIRFVEVTGRAATSSMRRIEPLEQMSLEGMKCIVKGAHYLIDGEKIAPTLQTETRQ